MSRVTVPRNAAPKASIGSSARRRFRPGRFPMLKQRQNRTPASTLFIGGGGRLARALALLAALTHPAQVLPHGGALVFIELAIPVLIVVLQDQFSPFLDMLLKILAGGLPFIRVEPAVVVLIEFFQQFLPDFLSDALAVFQPLLGHRLVGGGEFVLVQLSVVIGVIALQKLLVGRAARPELAGGRRRAGLT